MGFRKRSCGGCFPALVAVVPVRLRVLSAARGVFVRRKIVILLYMQARRGVARTRAAHTRARSPPPARCVLAARSAFGASRRRAARAAGATRSQRFSALAPARHARAARSLAHARAGRARSVRSRCDGPRGRMAIAAPAAGVQSCTELAGLSAETEPAASRAARFAARGARPRPRPGCSQAAATRRPGSERARPGRETAHRARSAFSRRSRCPLQARRAARAPRAGDGPASLGPCRPMTRLRPRRRPTRRPP